MVKKVIPDFRARYGPWALVAGASTGLGAEFATRLAGQGLNLVLVARRKEMLVELAATLTQEYQIEVRTIVLDLGDEHIEAEVKALTDDLEIGLLVYNAATSIIGPFFASPLPSHMDELMVNCRAPLILSYLFGARMLVRKRGGIILMSSLSSSQGTALVANYGATKAYNKILAEGLWEELRTQGVDVLTCAASTISTPNYLASTPHNSTVSAMTPHAVVAETLAALGRHATVIPGAGNRLANFVMQRVLPHRMSIQLIGRVMRSMYAS